MAAEGRAVEGLTWFLSVESMPSLEAASVFVFILVGERGGDP